MWIFHKSVSKVYKDGKNLAVYQIEREELWMIKRRITIPMPVFVTVFIWTQIIGCGDAVVPKFEAGENFKEC